MDADLRSAGVANDIRQCFLEYPEKGSAEVLVEQRFPDVGMDITPYPGAGLEIVGLPFERSCQAQVIKHRRPQFAGNR